MPTAFPWGGENAGRRANPAQNPALCHENMIEFSLAPGLEIPCPQTTYIDRSGPEL